MDEHHAMPSRFVAATARAARTPATPEASFRWHRVAFVIVAIGSAAVLAVFVAITVRLGVEAITGPPPSADAVKALWAFAGAAAAAAVTLTGLFFTRTQAARSEQRLALDTAVKGLQLLAQDGPTYSPRGVVAGALATLVHLEHPVIAMRSLAACWADDAVDTPTATWLISEVLDAPHAQAHLEAAALLDAHAHQFAGIAPGSFSWPAAIEFRWMPEIAPLPARLLVLRAVLTTLVSRPRSWWREGGREGWAVALLHHAVLTDPDDTIKAHAAFCVQSLLPDLNVSDVQSAEGWISVTTIQASVASAPARENTVQMLGVSLRDLEAWASA
jgi:hypothetical protein